MAYIEASLIVAGALDEVETFPDDDALALWVSAREDELAALGRRGEVYLIHHEHEQDIECECVQYLTDHHPYRTLNPAGKV